MKNVSLFAVIGCGIITILYIATIVLQLQAVISVYGTQNLLENPAMIYVGMNILGIVAWIFIGYFFYELYRKEAR